MKAQKVVFVIVGLVGALLVVLWLATGLSGCSGNSSGSNGGGNGSNGWGTGNGDGGSSSSFGAFGPQQAGMATANLGEACYEPGRKTCTTDRKHAVECDKAQGGGYAWTSVDTCEVGELCLGDFSYDGYLHGDGGNARCANTKDFCDPHSGSCRECLLDEQNRDIYKCRDLPDAQSLPLPDVCVPNCDGITNEAERARCCQCCVHDKRYCTGCSGDLSDGGIMDTSDSSREDAGDFCTPACAKLLSCGFCVQSGDSGCLSQDECVSACQANSNPTAQKCIVDMTSCDQTEIQVCLSENQDGGTVDAGGGSDAGANTTDVSSADAGDPGPTWCDSTSNLTWQVNPAPYTNNWDGAKNYCTGLGDDWHLPTISELRSLIRGCTNTEKNGPCGVTDSCLNYGSCSNDGYCSCSSVQQGPDNGCYWPKEIKGIGETCFLSRDNLTWYWSSSLVEDRVYSAWLIQFDSGSLSYNGNTAPGAVRCVRSGSCGGTDGGTTDQGGTDAGGSMDGGTIDTGTGGTANFKGTLFGFGGDMPVPDITVDLLSNDTGDPLGPETTSHADGIVTFSGLPAGKVGFKAVGVEKKFVDTYQFNIESDAQDETLWVVPYGTYTMAPAMAGLTLKAGKGVAIGAVYWVDNAGKEFPIGCATVELSTGPSNQVRYFGDNGLPARIDVQTSINKANGYFLIANMAPGKVAFNAKVETEVVGRVTSFAYADSVTIGNIYADAKYTSNPGKCP